MSEPRSTEIEGFRLAAALMRERAGTIPAQTFTKADVAGVWLNSRFHLTMPPAAMLALADWLDGVAADSDSEGLSPHECERSPEQRSAITLTHAYLGERHPEPAQSTPAPGAATDGEVTS